MEIAYKIFTVIALIVAIAFAALVFLTGKGDAMGGSSGIRTSYKGKASFDDIMSRLTLSLGIAFLVLMVTLDFLGNRIK